MDRNDETRAPAAGDAGRDQEPVTWIQMRAGMFTALMFVVSLVSAWGSIALYEWILR